MGPIDASIVYISLPAIASVFEVDPTAAGWVSMSYLLVLSCFLLSLGRLGDMFGFKRIFLIGLLLFIITSALCGLAWSFGSLVFFRALQAFGAGMTMAMGPAIITATFPSEERGRALGMFGMVIALGLAIGPSLGGTLVDLAGWRSIFYVNIPIGIVSFFWSWKVLAESKPAGRQRFDWQGSVLAFLGLASLLFFASRGQAVGWSYPILILGGFAILFGIWFVQVEKKMIEPMLDLSLFKNRVFSAGNSAALLHFMTQYVIVFLAPFFMQYLLGYSAGQSGIIMTAFPLVVLVTAPLAGILSDKIGQRGLAFGGSFLCTIAAVTLAMLDQESNPAEISWRLGLFGLGTGLFQPPNNSAVMGSVPKYRLGIAGGVMSTIRNVGMVFGIAIGGAVLAVRHAFYLSQSQVNPFLLSLRDAFFAAALLSAISALFCLIAVPQQTLQGGEKSSGR